jgi:hypothetical protein
MLKRQRNEVSPSISVTPSLACDKQNLCDPTQSGVGKLCVKERKYV